MLNSKNLKPGQFQSERFYSNIKKCYLVQWDYRDSNGKLHSGVCRNLADATNKASKFGYRPAF